MEYVYITQKNIVYGIRRGGDTQLASSSSRHITRPVGITYLPTYNYILFMSIIYYNTVPAEKTDETRLLHHCRRIEWYNNCYTFIPRYRWMNRKTEVDVIYIIYRFCLGWRERVILFNFKMCIRTWIIAVRPRCCSCCRVKLEG